MPFYRRRKPLAKRSKRKSTRKPRTKKGMVALVKSVIQKQAEVKVKNFASTDIDSIYGVPNGFFRLWPVTPYSNYLAIDQGTSQSQRLGNEIRTVKCFIKFTVWPAPYDATSNNLPTPQNVRLVIFKSKDYATTLLAGNALGNFFQYGGTTQGPTGDLRDMVRSINKDSYTVYVDKQFKIGNAVEGGTGGQFGNQFHSNNDFPMNRTFTIDITRHCARKVIYSDNSLYPQTKLLQMVFFSSPANGSPVSLIPLKWTYEMEYRYSDI